MHPGRILGLLMGLLILAAIFALPFYSTGSQALYDAANPVLRNLPGFQLSGNFATLASAYVLVIAFILLVIAGLVGIFPLGTGVLGVVAMAMITAGSILINPSAGSGSYGLASYGLGYFVIWIASIISLAASFWHRSGRKQVVNVNVAPAVPPK